MRKVVFLMPYGRLVFRKIRSFYKKIRRSPPYFLVFLFGRFIWVRLSFSHLSKPDQKAQQLFNQNSDSLFSDLDSKTIVTLLQKHGIFEGILLPEEIREDILEYVDSHDCFIDGKVDQGFKISEKDQVEAIYGRSFYVARYFNTSTTCTGISKLANDPKFWEIATQYIGKAAKYTGASLYWTFPLHDTSKPYEFSQFHYDLEDYNSLRFCFYLTDVHSDSGPHVCIQGSHRRKPIKSIFNYFSRIFPEEKLIEFYGFETFNYLIGKAGFGFIEDVFCFHRGAIPVHEPRLFLQLHFATNNYVEHQYHDHRDPKTLKSIF
ncbi:hypothetical protein PCC7418_1858 [Halothece sp. PCC 7418]|uniref:hypothetical protein n=1 Tax=Halothece sp. (strain PCC 7418) TaxID=65093 RepID=UPI0002A06137|nr:hypothetical protein [Halothece sp. PCC 7418]AFZ44026.1 hypothetical protein PCC7418_1858 [Halothece sp. PCC 7418]